MQQKEIALLSVIFTGAIANSIRSRTSIHFGLYYSLFEWFNPLYLSDQEANFTKTEYVKVQWGIVHSGE